MNVFIGATAGVAAMALASCASTPVSEATAAAAPPASAATTTPAATQGKRDPRVPYNYRMVTRDNAVLYCRKDAVNGSRTQVVETCLTAGEIQAEEQKAAILQRDMDDSWEKKPVMDNNIGQSNTGLAR